MLLFCLITFLSLIAAAAWEEDTARGNLVEVSAFWFYICRFPTHTLFFEYLDGALFMYTLVLNCFFNAFLIERLTSIRFYRSGEPVAQNGDG